MDSLGPFDHVEDAEPVTRGLEEIEGLGFPSVFEPQSGCTVYLVGGAHVSSSSAELAALAVRVARPSALFVELCEARSRLLVDAPGSGPPSTLQQSIAQWGQAMGTAMFLLSRMTQAAGEALKANPGAEFRTAAAEARKLPCPIHLVDREVSVTLGRCINSMTFIDKLRMMYHLVFHNMSSLTESDVESLKNGDMTALIKELKDAFPGLVEALLTERDKYMAYVVRGIASKMHPAQDGRPLCAVAVVGLAHVDGIRRHWGKVTRDEFRSISAVGAPVRDPVGAAIVISSKVLLWSAAIAAVTVAVMRVTARIASSKR
jgi:pheromone shutdown protein TraB